MFLGLRDGQTPKTYRRQGTGCRWSINTVVSAVGFLETHQHGQLAWPTVEANWIFVKSFLKQISVRETLKTLRSKDLLPLSQPVKAFRICCSGKGLLPVGRTLQKGPSRQEETCWTPGVLWWNSGGTLSRVRAPRLFIPPSMPEWSIPVLNSCDHRAARPL